MKKLTLLLLVSIYFGLLPYASGQVESLSLDWAKAISGSSHTNFNTGTDMVVDNFGNVYVTGFFQGTVDFDSGPNTYNITSAGSFDVYIAKFSSTGSLLWAKTLAGYGDNRASGITIDGNNNIYVTGIFTGTIDLDPGAGVFNKSYTSGSSDIFIVKLNSNGDLEWGKAINGGVNDCFDIIYDGYENIYTVGIFTGTVDFDPGVAIHNLTSSTFLHSSYLLKLDTSGNFTRVTMLGNTGTTASVTGSAITCDANGNLYCTGIYTGTVDFDPSSATFNLSPPPAVYLATFIQKLDSSGTFQWARSIGTGAYIFSRGVKVSSNGAIYFSGNFEDTVDFDPGAGIFNLSSNGAEDVYVEKLDQSGNFVWAVSFGGTNREMVNGLALDQSENVYITGDFRETVDFDPGPDSLNLTSLSNYFLDPDYYIQKLSSNGDFIMAKSIGGIFGDEAYAIHIDNNDKIYIAGEFQNTVDFDPTLSGITNVSSPISEGSFVQKLSLCMTPTSVDSIVSCSSYTWIDGITYKEDNNTASYTYPYSSCDSIVYLDLTISGSTVFDSIETCGSYTWINNITYNSSNYTAIDTLMDSNGCDSIVKLHLTINDNTGTDIIQQCGGSFTWIDNVTYTSSNNTATHILTNSKGCDSIVHLDLTIDSSSFGTDYVTACNSYSWIDGNTYYTNNASATHMLINSKGCDSIVSLHLTILQSSNSIDSVSACNDYTWIDGVTYTADNNTATFITAASNGCDSNITLNLNIAKIDTGLNYTNGTLSSQETSIGATYQWLNCDSGYAMIPGQKSNSFTPTYNGQFAVEIEYNGCTDTSQCFVVADVSTTETLFIRGLNVFPNPSNGIVYIEGSIMPSTDRIKFSIINNGGSTVYESFINNNKEIISTDLNLSTLPKGIYLLKIEVEDSIITEQVILQ